MTMSSHFSMLPTLPCKPLLSCVIALFAGPAAGAKNTLGEFTRTTRSRMPMRGGTRMKTDADNCVSRIYGRYGDETQRNAL